MIHVTIHTMFFFCPCLLLWDVMNNVQGKD